MKLQFETLKEAHRSIVMDIFNTHIELGTAAYPEAPLPLSVFDNFLTLTRGYPAYVLKLGEKPVGFCFLSALNPHSTFNSAALVTYFIAPEYTGRGLGKQALVQLEKEAKRNNITTLLANISSKNQQSLNFHEKNGFAHCGTFKNVGNKQGQTFHMVWMQKEL